MLKTIALAAALAATLSISTTTTASAMTINLLNEWSGFGEKTKTPVTAYNEKIDWANLYRTTAETPLIEWKGRMTFPVDE